jgi:hypothetical protein
MIGALIYRIRLEILHFKDLKPRNLTFLSGIEGRLGMAFFTEPIICNLDEFSRNKNLTI